MTVSPEPLSTGSVDRTGNDPRVDEMLALVRQLSMQTDPQQMVSDFGDRFRRMFPADGFVAVSRRGLAHPRYRITRSTRFAQPINPWKQSELLPQLDGGLLGELLYADRPIINNDFEPDADDPAFEHLEGFRSLMAVPHYHDGEAFNMAITLHREPNAFDHLSFADRILTHNLFGRATNQMVLTEQLRAAHAALDAEMKIVGEIQRSLLPQELPEIKGLSLAAHYDTASRAGGDYYDLFPLADGRWGILIADVSGHGTPAAVVMAVTHAVAHTYSGPDASEPCAPCAMLTYINQKLVGRYDAGAVMFVTAWYGVYDPADRSLRYAAAGHPPPRVRRGADLISLDQAGGLPLGISPHANYESARVQLEPDDLMLLFTDGITEAFSPERQQFGEPRLEAILRGAARQTSPDRLVNQTLEQLRDFTGPGPLADDQTLLAIGIH